MTENNVLIEAQHLTRRYGPTVAVSDLNLTLHQGEILGLLGPNGAGKTTTLQMLSGCLSPSEGSVHIHGVDLRDDPTAAKQHLGYLPEQPPLHPELTVHEYLHYCAGLRGIATAARSAAVAQALSACGLTDVASRLISNLSKGYQQRVGLAQATIHRPPVIILDEPTVGLDPNQIRGIRSLIKDLGKQHSVILSSHILPEIQAVCDRVMVINRGRVVYNEKVASDDTFAGVTVCLRRPPDMAQLRSLAGVSAVKQLETGRFRLQCDNGADPRDAVAAAAAQHDWGLYELRAEHKTLEEIFVELTASDDARLEAAA